MAGVSSSLAVNRGSAAEELATGLGWHPGMCDDRVLTEVARALTAIHRAGFEVPADVMPVYLRSIKTMADAEIAQVPDESVEAAVRYVVLGSVVVEISTRRMTAEQREMSLVESLAFCRLHLAAALEVEEDA